MGGEDQEQKDEGQNQPGGKVLVKAADMPDDMKESAVKICEDALVACAQEKDIAGYVKKQMDKTHGKTWHCIVGRNYGSFVTHEIDRFVYLYVDKVAVLLFKSA